MTLHSRQIPTTLIVVGQRCLNRFLSVDFYTSSDLYAQRLSSTDQIWSIGNHSFIFYFCLKIWYTNLVAASETLDAFFRIMSKWCDYWLLTSLHWHFTALHSSALVDLVKVILCEYYIQHLFIDAAQWLEMWYWLLLATHFTASSARRLIAELVDITCSLNFEAVNLASLHLRISY